MTRHRRDLDTLPAPHCRRTREKLGRVVETQDWEPSISVEQPDVQSAAGDLAGLRAWSIEVHAVWRALSDSLGRYTPRTLDRRVGGCFVAHRLHLTPAAAVCPAPSRPS